MNVIVTFLCRNLLWGCYIRRRWDSDKAIS